jgi:hypothetical protein
MPSAALGLAVQQLACVSGNTRFCVQKSNFDAVPVVGVVITGQQHRKALPGKKTDPARLIVKTKAFETISRKG